MADDPHKPVGRTFTRPGVPAALTEAQRRAQETYATKAEFVARKGEWVTCEAGHRICRIAKDIPYGGLYDPAYFMDWKQPEPKVGTLEQPCVVCGAEWFRGMSLHFGGGWR